MVAIVCLLAARVVLADPVVAIAPPAAASPALAEAALLMQAEAGRWLISTQRSELHVKQLLRALERHRIELRELGDPAVAARARTLLGAPVFIFGKLSEADGKWQLEVRRLDDKGPSPPQVVTLPAGLPAAIEAGGRALAAAVAGEDKALAAPLGTTSAAAAASYATCYGILIRQPISIDSPTVLSAADLERAVKSCRAAVAADAKFESAWAALGLALAISGQDADAVQALVRVRPEGRYQPLYWLARYWLVTRYQSPAAGVTALQQALKEHPGFLLARGYLAEHLAVTGKLDEALKVLQDYSTVLPKNAFVRGRISSTLAKLGRHDEAIAAAKAGIELDRTDPEAVLELGSRYLDAGKRDEAIEVLQSAVSGRSRGELFLRLGWAHFGKGDLAKAEALFLRAEAAATAPGEWRTRARARADLARVSEKRGDSVGARNAIERALEEGAGPYLKGQQDRRLVELVTALEKAPRKSKGPRILRPAELSPFTIDPAGEIDIRVRQYPTPPAQFELLRF